MNSSAEEVWKARMVESAARFADASAKQDLATKALEKGGGGGDSGGMDTRITALEGAVGRIEVTLARMDEKLSHLATKAELAGEVGKVNEKLATKPGTAGMWTMAIALIALVITAAALGPDIGPWLRSLFH